MRRRTTIAPRSSAAWLAALALATGLAGAPPHGAAQERVEAERTADELKRIERDLAGGQATKARLDRVARELGREIERLRAAMSEAATRQQRTEETVGEVEATLAALREQGGAGRAGLAGRQIELGHLTGALQRLARRPPEALLLMGRPPLETVRTGILLESAIPQINAEAERLKAELAALAEVESDIRAQRAKLDEAAAALDAERERLAALAAEKAELLSATESKAAGATERLRLLAESASSLRTLLEGIEEQRARERAEQERLASLVRPTPRPTEIAPPPAAAEPEVSPEADPAAVAGVPLPVARPPRGGPAEAAASLLALLPSAPPIATAKGRLIRPAVGSVKRQFGERDPEGLRNRGIVIESRPGATVVAPYDGSVIYAGPFAGFGLILIIEHGEGYHTLLAGLDRIGLQVGQRVLAGEPVGAMRSRQTSGGGGNPELYVELRHNGDPIDPLPWIAGLTGKAKG